MLRFCNMEFIGNFLQNNSHANTKPKLKMKKYTKTHANKKAFDNHLKKIKEREGQYEISGNTITYWFGDTGIYNTQQKKIDFASKKGNLLTFKKPISWKGESKKQIINYGLEQDRKSGAIKIIGFGYDSPWYKSINELIDAMDWEQMSKWHS